MDPVIEDVPVTAPAYDPAVELTRGSLLMVGFLTLFLCVCVIIQLVQGKPVATELWAALTGMIGWITAKLGTVFDNRFGSSRQSAAKDVVIQQMARDRR